MSSCLLDNLLPPIGVLLHDVIMSRAIFSLLQLYGFLMRTVQTLSFFIPLVSFIYGHVIVVRFVTVRAIVFTCYVHVHIYVQLCSHPDGM